LTLPEQLPSWKKRTGESSTSEAKEVRKMNIGYSTHGHWAPLKELKEIEVEDRGNDWFDDTKIDLESTEGIWVTKDPKDAIPYLFMASELESEEYQEALKHPKKYLIKVNLDGAIPVLEDGDGGTLYIRNRKNGGENLEPQKGPDIKQMIDEAADRITAIIHEEEINPLDGDETDRIGKLLALELDWRQGNVTLEEYETQLHHIEKV
jgi:hypothetical protein